MVNKYVRNVLIIVTYIATIVINYLSQILPLNGVTTAQVSDTMPNLFAPPGFTFAIWGVIYVLLGILVLYRLGVFMSEPGQLFGTTEDILLICSGLLNIAWVFCWHYGHIGLSVLVIVALLVVLATLYTRISRYKLMGANKWFVKLPVSVYFGWITVATITNISAWLVKVGWNGFGLPRQLWTIVVILVGACIGVLGTYLKFNYAYGLVFIWAYAGILYKHLSDKYYNGKYIMVIIALVLSVIILVAAEIMTMLRMDYKNYKELRREY